MENKRIWYRTTFFNLTIVGIAAFVAPGLYNALASTGAGGAQTPYLVMAGNAILNSLMFAICFFASMFSNRFGLKTTIYSASLYQNNRFGTEWFVYFGSACCGLSAGLFWAAEGAIMIGCTISLCVYHPEAHKRGRYLSMWLAYRNSGAILGGAINLGLNYSGKTTGKLNWKTYIVFVALQCLGPAIALLLSPPDKIQRSDGTKVVLQKKLGNKEELIALLKLSITRRVLLVLPLFFYGIFLLSWAGSYLSLYFSVRSRALASLVSAFSQITANFFFGTFLDWRRFTINERARYSYIFMMTLAGGSWIWATVVQVGYTRNKPSFDWVDGGFGRGWALYIIMQVNFALVYNYCYWMVSYLAEAPEEVVRYTSIVRAVEAAGGAVASGISSTKAPLTVAVGVNFGIWAVAVIPAWLVVRRIALSADGKPLDLKDPHASDSSSVNLEEKQEVPNVTRELHV
ncbi:hypothetical protein BDZ89DRAFT_1139200 [Hymenopellis radicata]|nr:hypothetical protein BDZ89DRAFT_1139200 [Hymenopellis radicata]